MKKLLPVFILLVFVLSGCSSLLGKLAEPTPDVAAAVEQTLAVQSAVQTLVAETQMAAQAQASVEAPATATPVVEQPTATVTPVPTSSVAAQAVKNANCRSGPDSNFEYLSVLDQGATAPVIGKNTDFGKWWKVRLADGTECWVIEDAITLTGDTQAVASLVSPITPTPIPAPDWNGTWTMWISGTFENKSSDVTSTTVKMVQTGNNLTYSFRLWGLDFTAYLTVSADGMVASGTLVREQGGTWNLYLYRVPENLNQFRGKWYYGSDKSLDGQNCGSKNGAPMPNPCR
jgi:hypothetical protein